MPSPLAERIADAIAQVEPLAQQGWEPAISILRQLRWCLAFVRGEPVEPAPGPFSMGLIATREFDMHGHEPELARLVNAIQREVERGL